MPSFDVVSRVDFQEIDNAIANALREITNRYDFKGSNTSVERKEKIITIVTDDDLKLSQVDDILISHFVRRKLDPLALGKKDKEKAGGDRIRQTITLVEGIEQDIAKKITSEIKNSKMKIQAKINGNELRIDGKKRDDLQAAMKLIEDLQTGIPIPPSLGLLARGNVAIFILCLQNDALPQSVLLATGLLWLMNVAIPALAGALVILRK